MFHWTANILNQKNSFTALNISRPEEGMCSMNTEQIPVGMWYVQHAHKANSGRNKLCAVYTQGKLRSEFGSNGISTKQIPVGIRYMQHPHRAKTARNNQFLYINH